MAGKRGPYKKSDPVLHGNHGSARCEFCDVNAPANHDGKPMAHFDGRVEKAWESQTYCDGKDH